MRGWFTQHLNDVNETYFKHMFHALYYFVNFVAAAFFALVHAMFPFLFACTASKILKKLHTHMSARIPEFNECNTKAAALGDVVED